MLSEIRTVNISQFEAAFNTDLGDQQSPLQTDKFVELGFRELDRNRRKYGIVGECWHDSMALFEDI